MAAEASTRRRVRNAAAVLALLGVAATGLVVAFRDESSSAAGRDVANGDRLRVTFRVEVEDQPLAEATATVRLANSSDQPAWYRGDECDGPGLPTIGPEGDSPRQAATVGNAALRDRLIAAGEASFRVELVVAHPGLCDPDGTAVRLDPGESVTWEYRSGADAVDRSVPLVASVVVREANRRGRITGRLRAEVPFPELPGGGGLTIDRAVDAFLADPTVVELVTATGEDGILVGVTREGEFWRMSLGSDAGDLSAEVRPDLTVRNVNVQTPPG